jgi:Leucine-rich repeat (LRR) protein
MCMKVDKTTSIYNSLLSCDINFFSFLSSSELNICHKLADYFLRVYREKVEEADLHQLQTCIDLFKQKKWMRDESKISKEALEAIYQKFHPIRITIDVISADILSYHILPEVAEFQTSQVSRTWATYSQTDEVWQSIAKTIGCSHLRAGSGQMHVAVKQFCKEFMANTAELPEATDDIKELIQGELTTEKMMQFVEWRKARDTHVVWKEIINDLNLPIPESLADENGNRVEQAKHFNQWLDDNPNAIRRVKDLDLKGKNLVFLPPEIGRLTALKRLDLSHNQLTTLPSEIGALSALKFLYIKDNSLIILPPEIGGLTALIALHVDNNKLTTLPPEIGYLTKLAFLYLSNNRLINLPPEVGGLTALRWVHLDNNHLVSLPSEIRSLHTLTSLSLNHNALTELPPGIGHLTALQELEVSHNKISTLPTEIGYLAELRVLVMSDNKLLSFPPAIGTLRALEILDLSNNKLINLPPEIGKLIRLRKLVLNNNELRTFPSEMGDLVALQLLYLSGNKFSTLPSEIRELPTIGKIWI